MNVLPEKLLKQRYKLQLVSLESPSDLPSSGGLNVGVSPMTELAINLSDTSLGLTPVQDSKRRLSMGSESTDSTPSPREKLNFSIETPLTSLTNKPKRLLQHSSRLSFSLLVSADEKENKENISPGGFLSPGKRSGSYSSTGKRCGANDSPGKRGVSIFSPVKKHVDRLQASPGKVVSPGKNLSLKEKVSPAKKVLAKKPMFSVFIDEDECNSRDSGYDSNNVEDGFTRRRKPSPGSLDEILQDCSPDKEEGFAPLKSSPERTEIVIRSDGFDFESLATISEDQENESPKFDLNSLLSNKIILPNDLDGVSAFSNPIIDEVRPLPEIVVRKTSFIGQKRPTFRRALSMLDQPTGSDFNSPVSRNSESFLTSRFKRPDPPKNEEQDPSCKRRKISCPLMEHTRTDEDASDRRKPKFYRSHSENQLSVMKSCQLKEEVENILPDSSRLYALPSLIGGNKHPSLRSISCYTLAQLIREQYSDVVHSFRIIDARYAFEFEGGHIKGAENWQHGEDEEFISAFLPPHPLPCPPKFNPDSSVRREILIFHCEFSSQRGPDFYMKLRERDRQLNQDVYPALHFPECYLLHLGYKEFFNQFPDLCTGSYTAMIDPKHEHDLRKMRAKSKSWSGGTIMRTGRMARLHL